MKAENKLMYKVIMYFLLFLCAVCISFHLTIYRAPSVHEIQDSYLASVNNEYTNSGDGNNNSLNHKIINNELNRITSNSKSDLLFFAAGTIILYIQISELYFIQQDYLSELIKRSLIAQKIRLNN